MDINIDQPQPASRQPVMEPELSQGSPRMPKFLGSAIIVLAVTIGYITLANFQHWFPFGSQRMTVSSPTPTATTTPTPTAVNVTADWKVYRNRNYEYGVEFKYPPTFTFKTCDLDLSSGLLEPISVGFDNSAVIKSENVQCGANKIPYGIIFDFKAGTFTSFREAVNSISMWHGDNFYLKPFGQFVEVKEFGPDGASHIFYMARFPYSDSYIKVTAIPTTRTEPATMMAVDYEKITRAILSTFKFVEPLPGPLNKIYRNEKYGFEIKVPANWEIRNDWGYGLNIGELYIGFTEFQSLDPTESIGDAPSQQELLKEKNDIDLTGALVNGRKVKTVNFYSPSGGDYIRMTTFFGGKSSNDKISLSIVINPTNFQELKDARVPADVVANNPENQDIIRTFNSIISTLSFF